MAGTGERPQGYFPGRAPIEAYGNGGFRFAGMSHRGSILVLPDGIHAWPVTSMDEVDARTLAPVLSLGGAAGFLLLGTGERQIFPAIALKEAFERAGIGLEPMSTGSACRTLNVLLEEGRAVSAALIAVA